jgi:hypothetical protein
MDTLDRYLADILPLIDTDQIMRDITELSRIEQHTDFDSFAESADTLRRQFASAGITSEILRFPADGRTKLQCWTAPIGFRTTRAICSIVEPLGCARVLGDRDVEPNTAIVGTGHTGPEGIEADVIHVEEQASVWATDVKGKIVYCSKLHPLSIRQAVIEGGGKAIVSSYTKHRELNRHYVHWVNTWDSEPDGWLPTARAQEENLPGISISPEMGDHLEECLAQGPVRLRVVTEGAYFESEFLGVTAALEGQEDRWVLITGHLYEQGLTDNAAGAIVGCAVSKAVSEYRRRLNVPRLRRGLRNMHSQECYAALALGQYYPEIPAKAFAHLNIDMIGVAGLPVGLLPGLLASSGLSGFLLRLILGRARALVPSCQYKAERKFDINCTLLADPLLGGVPTTQLEQLNPAWHTSRDRDGVQELDRDTIAFAALAAATWVCFLVAGGDEEAEWLLAEFKKDVEATLRDGSIPDTQIYLDLKQREMSDVATLASPGREAALLDDVRRFVASARAWIEEEAVIVPAGSEEEVRQSKRVFPRAVLGGPAVDGCFTPEQLEVVGRPKWSVPQLVLKSWADGTRSIYDITRLAIFETGEPLTLAYALAFFEHYAAQRIVSLNV